MSYCRWGWEDSQLYIFENTEGRTECHLCPLLDQTAFQSAYWLSEDWPAFLAHLDAHDVAGHAYPARLRDEITRAP